MFGIGMSEMVVILAIALLVFGPNKLPEIAKQLAKGLREIRKAGDDLRANLNFDLDDERPRPRPMPRAIEPPANIPGSALADKLPATDAHQDEHHDEHAEAPSTSAAAMTEAAPEPWPKPAEGTLAQGAPLEPEPPQPMAAAPEAAPEEKG